MRMNIRTQIRNTLSKRISIFALGLSAANGAKLFIKDANSTFQLESVDQGLLDDVQHGACNVTQLLDTSGLLFQLLWSINMADNTTYAQLLLGEGNMPKPLLQDCLQQFALQKYDNSKNIGTIVFGAAGAFAVICLALIFARSQYLVNKEKQKKSSESSSLFRESIRDNSRDDVELGESKLLSQSSMNPL